MIIPMPVVVAVLAWLVVSKIIEYLRKNNCDDRVYAAKQQAHRDAIAAWNRGFESGQQVSENLRAPRKGKSNA